MVRGQVVGEEISRRTFLKLSATTGAAAALGWGEKSPDKLIPYVTPPENVKPTAVTVYATTCRECPAGCGMHVWHRNGRVTKVEGNPDHPVNRGGLCPRGQSAVQGLYDPDRLKKVLRRERGKKETEATWDEAIKAIAARLKEKKGKLWVISDLQTGALAEVLESFAAAFGGEKVIYFEPFNYEAVRAGNAAVFGRAELPDYRLNECRMIVSFAADFLENGPSPVRAAWQFAEARMERFGQMARFVYVGPRLSMTAANADEFLKVSPGAERWVALAMAKEIIDRGWAKRDISAARPAVEAFLKASAVPAGVTAAQVAKLAKQFVEAGTAVALAGPAGATGPAATETAMAAALLNFSTGNLTGNFDDWMPVNIRRPHALGQTGTEVQLREVFARIGGDDAVIVNQANPVYARNDASAAIGRAGMVVYLGTMPDETAELATWVLPVDSPLESWGDYVPFSDVQSLVQPAMTRLYDTRGAGDVLLALAKEAGKPLRREGAELAAESFEVWLRGRWDELWNHWGKLFVDDSDFKIVEGVEAAPKRDEFWRESLRKGGRCGYEFAGSVEIESRGLDKIKFTPLAAPAVTAGTVEFWAWAGTMLHDGRVANRSWLQENPDPTSMLVWGSTVDLHPATAKALGVEAGDVVGLGEGVEAPVRVTEDVVEGVAALGFGQGHTALGRNAAGRGANAFRVIGAIRTVGQADRGTGENNTTFGRLKIIKMGRKESPVYTTTTQEQSERKILQWATVAKLRAMKPGEGDALRLPLPEGYDPKRDMYKARPHQYKDHRWAMVIDLHRCIGCGACAVACYAENNLAVVGEKKVRQGREMAWLRVVPYRREGEAGRLGFLPMLCQQCDAAPCEAVCPVFAAVHNDEGLNAQVYNRCIGTRYCSNNCPYKVRRFNWGNVDWAKPLDWQLNPDVTVRTRGVMEKCTFCIQRIRTAEIRAKLENRAVAEGEIKPACVQSCPTRVFTFGDLLDPKSEVSKLTGGRAGLAGDPRRYHVLEDLNTKPAVTYLRRILMDDEV
jgi:molybdopterin-containing oxidoreductase family iron-sulfur binding subunit